MRWPWQVRSADPEQARASERVLDRLDDAADQLEDALEELRRENRGT